MAQFEFYSAPSMGALCAKLQATLGESGRSVRNFQVQKDGDTFCAIVQMGPTEVFFRGEAFRGTEYEKPLPVRVVRGD